jgi:hypothetical protein
MEEALKTNKAAKTIGLALACSFAMLLFAAGAQCNKLRISTLGGCRIALYDEENQLNPYDQGRNSAYLLLDYEERWTRITFGLSDVEGDLKRDYDPYIVNDINAGAFGIKKLSDRHAVRGGFIYSRIEEGAVANALEYNQYNDPFYLTDLTTGDFVYHGPKMYVDYALRLAPKFYLGLGVDYDISTGLKQEYTRPEITHNYLRGNFGLLYEANSYWTIGLVTRPLRHQNRTRFDKTEEGYDNIIHRYSGDAIYEVRSWSSYTLVELENGIEVALQNFFELGRFGLGTTLTYDYHDNEITYGSTTQYLEGYWESTMYDFSMLGRYDFESIPLTIGISGRLMTDDGWAKRPQFSDVLLYESPMKLASGGIGFSWRSQSGFVIAADYILNYYDVEAHDYGANLTRAVEVGQNVGRIGIEYNALNVYSLRLGADYTDYLIDRWVKYPSNIDIYRIAGGFKYNLSLWALEMELAYGNGIKEDSDASRRYLSGIVWFTRSIL